MSQELPAPQTQPPALPAVPGVTVVTPKVFTKQDVAALRQRRSALSDQLNSASNRRRETRDALRNAVGADRAGLEQRLGTLDARIARLETDIDENGKPLASIEAIKATIPVDAGFSYNRSDRVSNNMVPIAVVFTLFVLAPIAISIARMFWKRGSMPRQIVQSPENAQRLERMEQAIDSIAIEMERVSEGQRFITRIMSDNRAVGEGQRAAQPLPIPVAESAGAPRY